MSLPKYQKKANRRLKYKLKRELPVSTWGSKILSVIKFIENRLCPKTS